MTNIDLNNELTVSVHALRQSVSNLSYAVSMLMEAVVGRKDPDTAAAIDILREQAAKNDDVNAEICRNQIELRLEADPALKYVLEERIQRARQRVFFGYVYDRGTRDRILRATHAGLHEMISKLGNETITSGFWDVRVRRGASAYEAVIDICPRSLRGLELRWRSTEDSAGSVAYVATAEDLFVTGHTMLDAYLALACMFRARAVKKSR